jgi:hypothetical protein
MLKVRSFALAVGIYWGVGIFVLGLMAHYGWGTRPVDMLGSVYIGYNASFVGALIGGVWAFFDALIAAAIIAWLYNTLSGSQGPGTAGR